MCNSDLKEELEVIKSIYCSPGEFHCLYGGDTTSRPTAARLQLNIEEKHMVEVTFILLPGYPDIPPKCSLTCAALYRKQAERMKRDLDQYAQQLAAEPMLLSLATWIQQNIANYIQKPQSGDVVTETNTEVSTVALLRLDHMRARTKYVKIIQKWTGELNLSGRLMFQEKLIFILLFGSAKDIKEYITRQRTVNVDIDAKGRPCKERMMTVLYDEILTSTHKPDEFRVRELKTKEELMEVFKSLNVQELYDHHILPLYTR